MAQAALYSRGLCSSCRAALYSIARNERKRHLNVAESFVPGLTGSKRSGGTCWCRICSIGVVSKKRMSSRVSAAAYPAELNFFSKSIAIVGNGELVPMPCNVFKLRSFPLWDRILSVVGGFSVLHSGRSLVRPNRTANFYLT